MAIIMFRELEKLKRTILTLSTLVEEALNQSVNAVIQGDTSAAETVIKKDKQIDEMEIEVEEECLKILALHQPVATDLRFIVSVLKINNDLERVGDLAANISKNALYLVRSGDVEIPFDLPTMGKQVCLMLKKSLDALINLDNEAAREVLKMDDIVDNINDEMYIGVKKRMSNKPEEIDVMINLLIISRHLERIADLCTNIAEDVLYMIKGDIVRHHTKELRYGAKT